MGAGDGGGEDTGVDDQPPWVDNHYFATLTESISSSLDYLHNVTGWSVVAVSGVMIFILGRDGFPDETSLFALLAAFIFSTHSLTRSAKGYINVIRFSLLRSSIIRKRLQLPGAPSDTELRHLINLYDVQWALPIRRTDVFTKALLEFGFGYLLGITTALSIYTATRIPFSPAIAMSIFFAIVLATAEVVIFVRSPYMRFPHPHQNARRLK
jgi:hypothetical protein